MIYYKRLLPIIVVAVLVITPLIVHFLSSPSKEHPVAVPLPKELTKKNFQARPLTDVKYEASAKRLKQGQYLTEGILQCFTCHSPRNWDAPGGPPILEKKGSGGAIIKEDNSFRIVAPNITPDLKSGAGKWNDDMFARAIREGVGHDGRVLSDDMPYFHFKNLSDEDLASVIVYLRSLPPVNNIVPRTILSAELKSYNEDLVKSIKPPVPASDITDPVKRGKYLVSLSDCVGCHGGHSVYSSGAFSGGNLIKRFGYKAFSANITAHASGMAYGPEGFIFVMRTGKGGTLNPVMPWVAFKNMTNDDLNAIYSYLRTIPASQHYISNQKPFTHCEICEQEHGLGEKNKREKPTGIKLDADIYDQYAGHYWNEEFNMKMIITRKKNRLIGKAGEDALEVELIPQSEVHFLAPGWYLPISFFKDKNGNVTHLKQDSEEGAIFRKIQ